MHLGGGSFALRMALPEQMSKSCFMVLHAPPWKKSSGMVLMFSLPGEVRSEKVS